ncbi:LysE family transporter [Halarcobacter sp.]|uniref:LysE family translocator n=1 Tax=Halarcobacter sp. TaxID=2321133 RepID=UPI002AA638CB|nr:LysE family transporter [Halarcobacter sp.]
MGEYSFIFAIAVVFIFGTISPGPSFILVAKTAVSKPISEGIGVSIGLGLGAMFFTFLAILGLYTLFEMVPFLYESFKIIGALYLLYLAYVIWKYSDESLDMNMKLEKKSKSFFKAVVFGFITQISNPKTAIILGSIFAALLPQSLPEFGAILLCITAFVIDATWYCFVTILLSTKKSQKVYLKFKKYIDRVAGTLLGALGIKLAID